MRTISRVNLVCDSFDISKLGYTELHVALYYVFAATKSHVFSLQLPVYLPSSDDAVGWRCGRQSSSGR